MHEKIVQRLLEILEKYGKRQYGEQCNSWEFGLIKAIVEINKLYKEEGYD